MRKIPYDPFNGLIESIKVQDIYWTSGMVLLVIGLITQFLTRTPYIIQEPYWASALKNGLICFWLLLVLRMQVKSLLKSKNVWTFIPWLFSTAFGLVIMLLIAWLSSTALVDPAMVALTDTQTIEIEAQVTSKEIHIHHGNNYYLDVQFKEDIGGSKDRSFQVRKGIYEQFKEGDWAMITFQQSNNGLLYHQGVHAK